MRGWWERGREGRALGGAGQGGAPPTRHALWAGIEEKPINGGIGGAECLRSHTHSREGGAGVIQRTARVDVIQRGGSLE